MRSPGKDRAVELETDCTIRLSQRKTATPAFSLRLIVSIFRSSARSPPGLKPIRPRQWSFFCRSCLGLHPDEHCKLRIQTMADQSRQSDSSDHIQRPCPVTVLHQFSTGCVRLGEQELSHALRMAAIHTQAWLKVIQPIDHRHPREPSLWRF